MSDRREKVSRAIDAEIESAVRFEIRNAVTGIVGKPGEIRIFFETYDIERRFNLASYLWEMPEELEREDRIAWAEWLEKAAKRLRRGT